MSACMEKMAIRRSVCQRIAIAVFLIALAPCAVDGAGFAVVAPTVSASLASQAAPERYSPTLAGHIVQFSHVLYQADGDPVNRLVIAATLHSRAFPETTMILSTYLETFQPSTTPILPDLLNTNEVATSLGGFITGKAVLINARGQISYQGGVLAETFLDNTVHLVMDLDRSGAAYDAPSLKIHGHFTINADKQLTVNGALRADRPLAVTELAALRVVGRVNVSWRTIVNRLTVPLPPMMGTSGNVTSLTVTPPAAPLSSTTVATARTTATIVTTGGPPGTATPLATPVPTTHMQATGPLSATTTRQGSTSTGGSTRPLAPLLVGGLVAIGGVLVAFRQRRPVR